MATATSFPVLVHEDDHNDDDDPYHHHTNTTTKPVMSNPRNDKYNQIRECLMASTTVDDDGSDSSTNNMCLWELRELALSRGGLVNDELRQKVWPSLAGLREDEPWFEQTAKLFEPSSSSTTTVCSEMEDCERDLIRRDVGRSVLFHHSCPSPNSVMGSFGGSSSGGAAADSSDAVSVKSIGAEHTTSILASVLTCTINTPLSSGTEKPHYYQGLHDIGGVLLHNLDYHEVTTTAILRQLCQSHLKDCVKENFADLQWFLNSVLLRVVEQCDAEVHEALVLSGVPLLSTVLPWILTWFTHSMHDEEGASRLIDAFMASHPLLPFYVSIALLVHPVLRHDIVTAELDDPSSMHFAIQNLPSRIQSDWATDEGESSGMYVSAQDIIETAISIMEQQPPHSLLQLVDAPERAEKMGLMKSLSFWTLDGDSSTTFKFNASCTRAKLASGVPVLMTTQPSDAVAAWRKPFGPPPVVVMPVAPVLQQSTTVQRTVFQVYRRRIRNTSRSIRRRMPKSNAARFCIFYTTCIVSYAIYDWTHYMYVFYMAQLFMMAH